MPTATATAERRFYFGGAHFNPTYHAQRVAQGMDVAPHAEHLGGGWWLLMADQVWHEGIDALVVHTDESATPDAWTDPVDRPRITMSVLAGRTPSLMALGAVPAEGWAAFGKALTGALGDVLARMQEV